ncbi:hypothetical protein ACFWVF_12920 [Streptomyces sp. NPDC058659]|uniref:hypothetical protein n=1 Tax=unclassified Streptomyces TaxID=2593676 RepID=UPI00365F0863
MRRWRPGGPQNSRVFLRVDGGGATVGWVAVSGDVLRAGLVWADPACRQHFAVGTLSGPTAINRC